MLEVHRATARDRTAISKVLATAFEADPVIRWLLPNRGHHERLFRALATCVHAAPGCADIALDHGELVGAALWDPPGHRLSVREGVIGSARLLWSMGSGVRRGAALEHTFARARPAGQFWYLAQIGASVPGRGIGSALLGRRVETIEGPAYLESSNRKNVPLYQRFGFEVIEEISLPEGGPTLWTMLRP